jgi:hypothetical protein
MGMGIVAYKTEKEFMQRVIVEADLQGWYSYHTYNSRRSREGFPDLVLVHPAMRKIYFWECKRDVKSSKLTVAQAAWLKAIQDVYLGALPPLDRIERKERVVTIDARVIRPSDADTIIEMLKWEGR